MRTPAAKAGTTRKMYDWECQECFKHWEALANQAEIDNGDIKCSDCQAPARKLLSAPRVDSHAAANWRR